MGNWAASANTWGGGDENSQKVRARAQPRFKGNLGSTMGSTGVQVDVAP